MAITKIKARQLTADRTSGRVIGELATSRVDIAVAGKQPLYTVPEGSRLIVTDIYLTLLAAADFADFGTSAVIAFSAQSSVDRVGFVSLSDINQSGQILKAVLTGNYQIPSNPVLGFFASQTSPAVLLDVTVFGCLVDG